MLSSSYQKRKGQVGNYFPWTEKTSICSLRKHFGCLLCLRHILGYGESTVNRTEGLLFSRSLHPTGKRHMTNKQSRECQMGHSSAMLEMKQRSMIAVTKEGALVCGIRAGLSEKMTFKLKPRIKCYAWEHARKGHPRQREQPMPRPWAAMSWGCLRNTKRPV